jgi:hypothetical protein
MPRPDQHANNVIHPWVFIQTRVWIDAKGGEHEIATMTDDYVANVIVFCREQARRILRLAQAYTMDELWQGLKTGHYDQERELDYHYRDQTEALEWLEATPLLHALLARLGNPSEAELAEITQASQEAYEAKQAKKQARAATPRRASRPPKRT